MPHALPCVLATSKTCFIVACTSGCLGFPKCPNEADKSLGPTKIPSTTSTAVIASTLSTACRSEERRVGKDGRHRWSHEH